MTGIHAIILTLDEEQHIARCIGSLGRQCASITVVDSGSTDFTAEIARSLGAEVVVNNWTNYATQMNFAIDHLANRGGWLLRIDADEVLANTGRSLVQATCETDAEVDALLVSRHIHFLGRRIRHGSIEPSWQLRLWRNGRGRCEQRWMDEHIKVKGTVKKSDLVISDLNRNSLSWWTHKHNNYASREAIDILNLRHRFLPRDTLGGHGVSHQAAMKRLVKEHMYLRLPSGLRANLYFWYRYLLRLGFLDGVEGYYFHALQGFWYRTLVDAKVREIEAYATAHGVSIIEAIRACTTIDPLASMERDFSVFDHGSAS